MSFQKVLRPLVVCSALFAAAQLAPAQSKVAVINLQKSVFDTAEIKKAETDMQATFAPRQAQGRKLQEDLAAITQKLQGEPGKLTPQAEFDLNAEGKRKQVELTRINEDLQADAEKMRNEILSKSTDKMQAVVKKLAEEKGYDLVVDTQVALYFKPAMDVTGEATAAYDKAYPVPAAPPAKK
ncbi:MAG: OmpH family outer membrane protein [Bryobacteraceae bacterium]|jgi:outer membrane protein